jgi:hypothetical protein
MFVGMSSSVKKKLQIEGDIPTNMSYQDTTLDLYFFLYRRWHPYKHVLSRYYPWFVVFCKEKIQIKGGILIRHVCRDVIFCKEKLQIKGSVLIRHVCRDVIFCKEKIQIKGSILIRHVCRDVIFCKEKTTNQG